MVTKKRRGVTASSKKYERLRKTLKKMGGFFQLRKFQHQASNSNLKFRVSNFQSADFDAQFFTLVPGEEGKNRVLWAELVLMLDAYFRPLVRVMKSSFSDHKRQLARDKMETKMRRNVRGWMGGWVDGVGEACVTHAASNCALAISHRFLVMYSVFFDHPSLGSLLLHSPPPSGFAEFSVHISYALIVFFGGLELSVPDGVSMHKYALLESFQGGGGLGLDSDGFP